MTSHLFYFTKIPSTKLCTIIVFKCWVESMFKKKVYPVYLYQVIWSSDMNISQRIIPIISTCDILTLGKHTSTSKWENYPAPFTDTLQLLRADMLTHKSQEWVNILHYKERSEVRVTSKVYRHCIGCSLGMHFVVGLFRLNRPAARLPCPEPVAIDNTPGFVYTLLYALIIRIYDWILNMKYVLRLLTFSKC